MKKYETKGQSSFGNNQDRAKRNENEANKQKTNTRNAPSISETRQRAVKEPRKKS